MYLLILLEIPSEHFDPTENLQPKIRGLNVFKDHRNLGDLCSNLSVSLFIACLAVVPARRHSQVVYVTH